MTLARQALGAALQRTGDPSIGEDDDRDQCRADGRTLDADDPSRRLLRDPCFHDFPPASRCPSGSLASPTYGAQDLGSRALTGTSEGVPAPVRTPAHRRKPSVT